jgi:hypothetical protein
MKPDSLWSIIWSFWHLWLHKICSKLQIWIVVSKRQNCKIKQNLNIPAHNWESGFWFGFCKEENWIPHWKTLAQQSRTVLNKVKRVTGEEHSNVAVCWEGWKTSRGHKGRIFMDKKGEFSWTLLVNFRGDFCLTYPNLFLTWHWTVFT